MSYSFEPGETINDGVRRVMREEIDKAETMLGKRGGAREEGVHEARKSFKKIRAVLRLVRPSLGATYAAENAWYRDRGRELSEMRDAQALLESFEKLEEAFAGQLKRNAFARIRAALEENRDGLGQGKSDLAQHVKSVRAQMKEARCRLDAWPILDDEFEVIGAGLVKTYARGRKAKAKAYAEATDEQFHDWRKRVKYNWYHLRLLQPAWPEVLKGYRSALKELSTLLGDDHDLAVMRQTLAGFPTDLRTSEGYPEFLALLDQRQSDLRAQARLIGARVYCDKPAWVEGRMGTIWSAWRGLQRSPVTQAAEADGRAQQPETYAPVEA